MACSPRPRRQPPAAYCWGNGTAGAVGNGKFADAFSPQPVVNLTKGVSWLSAGTVSACAIVGGQIYCWGECSSAAMLVRRACRCWQASQALWHLSVTPCAGDCTKHACGHKAFGSKPPKTTAKPVLVDVLPANRTWEQVAVGDVHVCAMESRGASIWCFGYVSPCRGG